MGNPAAHDYGPIDWYLLDAPVEQAFFVGSGYAAAVANDPAVTPAELVWRFRSLPGDAHTGRLEELRVGLRGIEEPWQSGGARLQLRYVPELDLRFPERDPHAWPDDEIWLPELNGGTNIGQIFVSPYPDLNGVSLRIATFQGDLTPGEALVGSGGATVWDHPIDGQPIAVLQPGQTVGVTTALEGHAAVVLPDGELGYVPLDAFVELPPPAREVAGPLIVDLISADDGTVVRRVEVPGGELRDNSHLDVRFEPVETSRGARYFLWLTMPDTPVGAGIALRATTTDTYLEGWLGDGGEDLVFRPLYAGQEPLLDVPIDTLPRDGDWLSVREVPPLDPGVVVAVRLVPGDQAGLVEYGVTRWRSPYGGWPADRVSPNGAESLNGALLFQTVYQWDIDKNRMSSEFLNGVLGMFRHESSFAILYGGVMGGLVIWAGWSATRLRRRGSMGGR
jgi:hypothetical protein